MSIESDLLRGSSAMLVLSLLKQEGNLYGYQIIQLLQEKSGDVLLLKEGTLYPVLYKLEEEELVSSHWMEINGRKRRYYQITPEGLKALDQKEKKWQMFIFSIGRVLGHE
ncbi:PadR family transcriptional regulator [Paenibacillus sp. SI8]|uniref:PadR family transcriptional regulator n=1 Tax=unclassified Paenibacillus TaxID=185978 RepID=UPI0034663E66